MLNERDPEPPDCGLGIADCGRTRRAFVDRVDNEE